MLIMKQKSIIYTHTKKRKESIHNTKDSHQITREENKGRRKEQNRTTNDPKTINKIALNTHLSELL